MAKPPLWASQQSLIREVGGGGLGGLRPNIQPLTLLCSILDRKRYPFRITSIEKWFSFYIREVDLSRSSQWQNQSK